MIKTKRFTERTENKTEKALRLRWFCQRLTQLFSFQNSVLTYWVSESILSLVSLVSPKLTPKLFLQNESWKIIALRQALGGEHDALFTLLSISVVSRFAPAPQNPFGRFSELEQQRRRRQRKRHLKSKVALLRTLSRLFHFFQFVKCWQFFLRLTNSKRLYRSLSKKKKAVVLCSRPPQNVELGTFTSQSCCDGKEMYKKA